MVTRRARRRKGSTPDLRPTLLSGRFSAGWNVDRHAITPPTMDELQAAWDQARDTLLPAFIAAHPGCRPWAWWKYDQPGTAWSGLAWPLHVEGRVATRDRHAPNQPQQSEWLDKHGLLSPAEREALELKTGEKS